MHGNSCENIEKEVPQTVEISTQTDNNVLTGETQTQFEACHQFTNTIENEVPSSDKLEGMCIFIT